MDSTDTNQASEDELDEQIRLLLQDAMGDFPTEHLLEYHTNNFKQAIQAIIRTEKLKLLAEVRERVIGESFKPSGFDERYSRQEGDNGHITHYETKKDADTINQHQEYQRTELTKLEAEL